MSKNRSLIVEVWDFLKKRKGWWLTPIIIMLAIVGVLIVVGQSNTALTPFFYALF